MFAVAEVAFNVVIIRACYPVPHPSASGQRFSSRGLPGHVTIAEGYEVTERGPYGRRVGQDRIDNPGREKYP